MHTFPSLSSQLFHLLGRGSSTRRLYKRVPRKYDAQNTSAAKTADFGKGKIWEVGGYRFASQVEQVLDVKEVSRQNEMKKNLVLHLHVLFVPCLPVSIPPHLQLLRKLVQTPFPPLMFRLARA